MMVLPRAMVTLELFGKDAEQLIESLKEIYENKDGLFKLSDLGLLDQSFGARGFTISRRAEWPDAVAEACVGLVCASVKHD